MKERRTCASDACYNKISPKKGGRFCNTCVCRKWRKKYPMKAAYKALRDNAIRRRKPFTISFSYFKRFCYKYDYMQGKGKTKESYSVDCKISWKGYVPGNLQVLTLSDNSKKRQKKMLVYDWETGTGKVIKTIQTPENTENPF